MARKLNSFQERQERDGQRGEINSMENKEFNDNLSFEAKKHQEFFLPFYKKKGWRVMQDNVGRGSLPWDVKLEMDGKIKTIDEKALRKDYGTFIAEILQDVVTGHLGWIYKQKDLYFYSSWNGDQLSSFYSVDAKLLNEFLAVNWKKLFNEGKIRVSERGWGITVFAVIEWQDLIYTKVAESLI